MSLDRDRSFMLYGKIAQRFLDLFKSPLQMSSPCCLRSILDCEGGVAYLSMAQVMYPVVRSKKQASIYSGLAKDTNCVNRCPRDASPLRT